LTYGGTGRSVASVVTEGNINGCPPVGKAEDGLRDPSGRRAA